MVNSRSLGRLGLLAVGLGIGAAVAYSPDAAADSSTDWLSSIDSLLGGGGLSAAPTDLNLAISIDGHSLVSDGSATADSGTGDVAIAYGANSTAVAEGGYGDYALADGSDAVAKAGDAASGATGSNFDSAIDIGNNDVAPAGEPLDGAYSGSGDLNGGPGGGTDSFDTAIDIGNNTNDGDLGGDDGAYAGSGTGVGLVGNGNGDTAIDIGNNSGVGDGPGAIDGNSDYASQIGNNTGQYLGPAAGVGNDDVASVVGNNSIVDAAGDLSGGGTTANNDIAYVLDPFGTDGSDAFSGFDPATGLGGNFDLAAILGVDDTTATAQGADYLYDIISALGNETGTAAATSGSGFLADLLSLF
jgi:hypothetical protein